MLIKFAALCVILSSCWCHSAANNIDHYGYNEATTTARMNSAARCINVHPQNSVDLVQMMGLWYGSEVIIHSQGISGTYDFNSCVIIHLTDVTQHFNPNSNNNQNNYNNNNNYGRIPTTQQTTYMSGDVNLNQDRIHQQRMKYLRLVWSEQNNNVEYTFNYTRDTPGVWSNIGDQRGSLAALNTYSQFRGTVQVVKAVNDHLVLTFCGDDVKSSVYTVVLSRNRMGLSSDEVNSIHSLLSRRNLPLETIRKVCNSAASLSGGMFLSLFLLLLLWCRRQ